MTVRSRSTWKANKILVRADSVPATNQIAVALHQARIETLLHAAHSRGYGGSLVGHQFVSYGMIG